MKKVDKNKVKNVAEQQIDAIKKIGIIGEFKEFISRGNVLDLAVGVIIGSAFQNLVTSLTNNIISPILGCFADADFSAYTLKIGGLTLKYGAFFTDIINFIIMAFVVFIIVKFMNKLFRKKENKKDKEVKKEVKEDSKEVIILEEIRDLLKNRE